jgi:hypothetical protein
LTILTKTETQKEKNSENVEYIVEL